jgi:cytoskeletal protein CcmA (bactofilin family)
MGLFGKPDPRPAQEPAPAVVPVPPAAPAAHAPARPSAKATVMGEKTRYVGKIDTDEPLLIQGPVEGEIKSSSEVEVGETGVVKATISGRSIVISGRVIGDCTASDKLEIRSSGKLSGSIHAARIVIAEGAEFKGTSQMAASHRS